MLRLAEQNDFFSQEDFQLQGSEAVPGTVPVLPGITGGAKENCWLFKESLVCRETGGNWLQVQFSSVSLILGGFERWSERGGSSHVTVIRQRGRLGFGE